MLTARAQRVYDLVVSEPGITNISGQTDYRNIAGTDKPSEHTWGNALDIYGSTEALTRVAKYLSVSRMGSNPLKISTLCYDPGVGRKYDHCTTKHTDHIHVDFGPKCGGNVPVSGSANEQVNACNTYQGGGVSQPPTEAPTGGEWTVLDDVNLNPFAGLQETLQTALFVALGVALLGAGIALLMKDSAVVQSVKSAVTKGIA